MKVSRKNIAVLVLLILTCILGFAAILLLRTPIILEDGWHGAPILLTTTPTGTTFPDQGWWISLTTFTETPSPSGTLTSRP